mgnify:CR=1 FL=1
MSELEKLVEVENLRKYFPVKTGLFQPGGRVGLRQDHPGPYGDPAP